MDVDFSDLSSQQKQNTTPDFSDLAPASTGGQAPNFSDLASNQQPQDNHSFFWDTMARLAKWANADNPQQLQTALEHQQQVKQALETPTNPQNVSEFVNKAVPKSLVNAAIGTVDMPDVIPNSSVGENLKNTADFFGMPIGLNPQTGKPDWETFKGNWENRPVETLTAMLPFVHGFLKIKSGIDNPTLDQSTKVVQDAVDGKNPDFVKYYEGQTAPVVSGSTPLTGEEWKTETQQPFQNNYPYGSTAETGGLNAGPSVEVSPLPMPQNPDLARQMRVQDIADDLAKVQGQPRSNFSYGSTAATGELNAQPTVTSSPTVPPQNPDLARQVRVQDIADDLAKVQQGSQPLAANDLQKTAQFQDLVNQNREANASLPPEAQRIVDLVNASNERKAQAQAALAVKGPDGISPLANMVADTIGGKESGGQYNIQENAGGPSYGKYQYLPDTWDRTSKAYAKAMGIGDDVLEPTPANQEAVTRWQIQQWLDQGRTPDQIASLWNSGRPNPTGLVGVNKYGKPFNAPAYVADFDAKFQKQLDAVQQGLKAGGSDDLQKLYSQWNQEGLFNQDQLKALQDQLSDTADLKVDDPGAYARQLLENVGIKDPTAQALDVMSDQGSDQAPVVNTGKDLVDTQSPGDNTGRPVPQPILDQIAARPWKNPDGAQAFLDTLSEKGFDIPPAKLVPNGDGTYHVSWMDRVLGNQSGAISPDLLTLGLKPFVEQSVAPFVKNVAQGFVESMRDVKSALSPTSLSEAANTVGNYMRGSLSEMVRSRQVAQTAMDGMHGYFDKENIQTGNAAGLDFINNYENGRTQPTPELQWLDGFMRSGFDDRVNLIQQLNPNALKSLIDNYFPHIWKDPQAAAAFTQEFMAKRPLEGSKDFLKQRSLDYFQEGLSYRVYDADGGYTGKFFDNEADATRLASAIGGSVHPPLDPLSYNPVDLVMAKYGELDKYIMAQKILKYCDDNGWRQFVKLGDTPTQGWTMVNDKVSKVMIPDKGVLKYVGNYFVPDEVARVINNYLSPGLTQYAAFRGYMGLANFLNRAQLSWSGFHNTAQAILSGASDLALAIRQVGFGDFGEAAKNVVKSAIPGYSVIENYRLGKLARDEWFSPGSQGAEMEARIQALQQGGARASMDQFYGTQCADRMAQAWRNGNPIAAMFHGAMATLEYPSKLIMEKLVPNIKMGAALKMSEWELNRLAAMGADDVTVRDTMAKVWDSVDNRFGQMCYDNLFWNKFAKDMGLASVRALGWDLGTVRELGGGAVDLLKTGKGLLQDKGLDISHRTAFMCALPVYVGAIGGIIQYLATGQGPQELKDYFFPKIGGFDEAGRDARISLPSYMKDVYSFAHDPKASAIHKINPLLQLGGEMLNNEDFYGVQIYGQDDPLVQKALALAEHAGAAFLPFSFQGQQRNSQLGQGTTGQVLPFVGIMPAPAAISKSDAENKASDLLRGRMPSAAITKEQYDKRQLLNKIQNSVRTGTPLANDDIDKLNSINQRQFLTAIQNGTITPLQQQFHHLNLEEAGKVFKVATPEERETIAPLYFMKLKSGLEKAAPADLEKILKNVQDSVGAR